jgi:cysteine desulfurase
MTSAVQLMAFDLAGLAVSAGSACSSGKIARSHVLKAMGVGIEEAASAIRVSLGWTTTVQDIDRFVEAWSALYARVGARLRQPAPAA